MSDLRAIVTFDRTMRASITHKCSTLDELIAAIQESGYGTPCDVEIHDTLTDQWFRLRVQLDGETSGLHRDV